MASKAMKVDSFLNSVEKKYSENTGIQKESRGAFLGQVSIDLKPHNWK